MSVNRIKIASLFAILISNCAYFNTFYNAQNYYREAKKLVLHDTLKVESELFDKTIEKATAVIIKYPRSRYVDDALFMMGVAYYHKGDYTRALEKFDFLTLNYPNSSFYDDALYYIGLSYYKQEKYGSAIVALSEAMVSKKFRVKSSITLCYVYYQERNYSALIEVAEELSRERLSSQERRWLLNLIGDAQFHQGKYAEALETFNELLSLARTKEVAQELKLKIAEVYLEMGDYEKCRDFLEGEQDPEFRNILADLNVQLGNSEKAKEIYKDVALHNPSDVAAQAFFELAELYRDADSLERAITYYDSSVHRASTSEYGIEAKKIVDVLRRIDALSKETEDIDRAQFLLAEIYFVDFNEPERAVVEYQKVYQNSPDSPWAPKALYAQLWITNTILKDDSLTRLYLIDLLNKYPNTEYAESAENMLGGGSSASSDEE